MIGCEVGNDVGDTMVGFMVGRWDGIGVKRAANGGVVGRRHDGDVDKVIDGVVVGKEEEDTVGKEDGNGVDGAVDGVMVGNWDGGGTDNVFKDGRKDGASVGESLFSMAGMEVDSSSFLPLFDPDMEGGRIGRGEGDGVEVVLFVGVNWIAFSPSFSPPVVTKTTTVIMIATITVTVTATAACIILFRFNCS